MAGLARGHFSLSPIPGAASHVFAHGATFRTISVKKLAAGAIDLVEPAMIARLWRDLLKLQFLATLAVLAS